MPDLREALESAMDTADESIPTTTEATDTPAAPITEAAPTPAATTPTSSSEPEVRDSLGRFVPKAKTDGDKSKAEAQPAPIGAPTQGAQPAPVVGASVEPVEKAPASWTVTAKQHWGALPPEVRQEVQRRELETTQVLHQSKQARDFVNRFIQTVQPYQQAIMAETGGDPIAAVRGLMDVASRLRFGLPQEKAQILAQLVNTYAVDIATLDSALAGVMPQQPQGFDPNFVQQAVQQQLAPLFQQAQARRQQMEQQLSGQVQTELQKFASNPKHEFYEDVRDLMADVIEINEKRGIQVSLDEAYNHAIRLHPEVAKIIDARSQVTSVQSLNSAAQRAKAAAVSVKGSAPVGSPDPAEPSSVRDAIEAAIESHSRV